MKEGKGVLYMYLTVLDDFYFPTGKSQGISPQ
jgi:hypothetical protein